MHKKYKLTLTRSILYGSQQTVNAITTVTIILIICKNRKKMRDICENHNWSKALLFSST